MKLNYRHFIWVPAILIASAFRVAPGFSQVRTFSQIRCQNDATLLQQNSCKPIGFSSGIEHYHNLLLTQTSPLKRDRNKTSFQEYAINFTSDLQPYITLELCNDDNCKSVNLTFDTGSYFSYLQPQTIKDLNLKEDTNKHVVVIGLGEITHHPVFSGQLKTSSGQLPGFILSSSPALEKLLKQSNLSGMLGLQALKTWGARINYYDNKLLIPYRQKEYNFQDLNSLSLRELSRKLNNQISLVFPMSCHNSRESRKLNQADQAHQAIALNDDSSGLESADRIYNIYYTQQGDPYIKIEVKGSLSKDELSLMIDTGACFGNITDSSIAKLGLQKISIKRKESLLHEKSRSAQYYKAFLGISQNPSYFGDLGPKNSQLLEQERLNGLIGNHILKGQMSAIIDFSNDTLMVMTDKPMPAFLDEEMQPTCQQRYYYGRRYTVCCDISRCWVQE